MPHTLCIPDYPWRRMCVAARSQDMDVIEWIAAVTAIACNVAAENDPAVAGAYELMQNEVDQRTEALMQLATEPDNEVTFA